MPQLGRSPYQLLSGCHIDRSTFGGNQLYDRITHRLPRGQGNATLLGNLSKDLKWCCRRKSLSMFTKDVDPNCQHTIWASNTLGYYAWNSTCPSFSNSMGIDTAALLMISCTEKVQADFRLGLTCSHKSRSVHFRVGTVRCCCVDIGFQGSRTVSKTFVGILEIIGYEPKQHWVN